jgi:hypothetical protein
MRLMLSRLHRQGRRELGELIVAGTPNLEIQPAKRALAQSAAVMAGCGREQLVRHHTPSNVYNLSAEKIFA